MFISPRFFRCFNRLQLKPRLQPSVNLPLALLLSVALTNLMTSCGGIGIGTGGGGSPNDARPSGPAIKQGQLFGSGVSGSVLVFFSSGSSYILRIEGLSMTSASNVVIQIFATPFGQVGQLTLRDSTGNQNYSFTAAQQGLTMQSVTLYNTITQTTLATAQFQ